MVKRRMFYLDKYWRHRLPSVPGGDSVSVLGREEGYTVKYTPSPEGVPEGEARGNS